MRYGSARDLQRKVVACFCGSPPTVTEFFLLVTSLLLLYATAISLSSTLQRQMLPYIIYKIFVNSQRLSSALSRTPPVCLFTSQVPTNRNTNKRQSVWRTSDYRPVDKNLLWIATPRMNRSIARISLQGQEMAKRAIQDLVVGQKYLLLRSQRAHFICIIGYLNIWNCEPAAKVAA